MNSFLDFYVKKLEKKYKLNVRENRIVGINHRARKYCSIQSLQRACPPLNLASDYFQWLSTASKKVINIKHTSNKFEIYLALLPVSLLELTLHEQTNETVIYRVTGGLLAQPNQEGTFSFSSNKTTSAIALEHFEPRLPWIIYLPTQALIHEIVMIQYQKKAAK